MKIAKLSKAITLLINVEICEYTHKSMGNTYSSAQVYLNHEFYRSYPFTYGDGYNLETTIKRELSQTLPKRYRPTAHDWLAKGVLLKVSKFTDTEKGCREHGEKI